MILQHLIRLQELPYYFVGDDAWTDFLVQEVIEIIYLFMR